MLVRPVGFAVRENFSPWPDEERLERYGGSKRLLASRGGWTDNPGKGFLPALADPFASDDVETTAAR